ncbi:MULTISPECIES: PTS transporter subunit EIIB, partial [unclassified Raoultella]
MNHLQVAQEIVARVGGVDNIEHVEHCSTRLRLSLFDNEKAEPAALEKISGVLAVRLNVQCQVVIGSEVIRVYDAVKELVSGQTPPVQAQRKPGTKQKRVVSVVMDFII